MEQRREIDNYKKFKKLKVLDKRNYDEVCGEVKAGRLSKDVELQIRVQCYYFFLKNDFNLLEMHNQPFIGTVTMSIIHVAIGLNDQEMIDHLLALNCNLQATTGYGNSVLQWAVMCNKLTTVEKLLDTGVDINDIGEDHQLLLAIAVSWNRYEVVELLISRGAQINDRKSCTFNKSPFGCAVFESNVNMMKLLISHGADVNLAVSHMKSHWTCTPLIAACSFDNSTDSIEFLLNHPYIDIQAVHESNETCVFFAARNDPLGYLQLILNTNIDINTKNIYNKLPLDVVWDGNNNVINRHIVKLIVAGFYVCEENREAVRDRKFDKLRAECSKEIQLMKDTKELYTNWSCFTILMRSQHFLALRFKHVEVSVDQEEEWIKKFPLYGKILAFHLKKALQRKMILKRTDQVLFDIFYKILPDTFIHDLYHFFSNYNLSKLLDYFTCSENASSK
ncbi:Similar to RF_0381: Putative ankyrin repeat protein RF_0381 (Rickettsia felis (strain ATCC VR-1525 / URRWXCal2)) [Cotesia congregata]|uniref:Similar to RF_0381: Putative ankyrin repeat protein RF_0381 (Rickettsia felis (Strain ATCC VR-1525 / URRWXCal2)) n=1 Tax=Cotesia congregata TaxID=51543 RepID=A0A8J2HJ98_COTCN|nr:Similar to RF_0381: Putative ankyrin repeat protein RF_0381 (Rickettsia felis (strain ATCC VR-1525 / URRWXCal2)) [Cotesia congregata]